MKEEPIIVTSVLRCPRCGNPATIRATTYIRGEIHQEFKVSCDICDIHSMSQVDYNSAIEEWYNHWY